MRVARQCATSAPCVPPATACGGSGSDMVRDCHVWVGRGGRCCVAAVVPSTGVSCVSQGGRGRGCRMRVWPTERRLPRLLPRRHPPCPHALSDRWLARKPRRRVLRHRRAHVRRWRRRAPDAHRAVVHDQRPSCIGPLARRGRRASPRAMVGASATITDVRAPAGRSPSCFRRSGRLERWSRRFRT